MLCATRLVACVRWVGHGIGRMYAREVIVHGGRVPAETEELTRRLNQNKTTSPSSPPTLSASSCEAR
jgi:hypothetical protein